MNFFFYCRHETKARVSGFPDNSYRGYNTVEECIEGWQALCRWGIHPHPVDPVHAVNTSPRKRAKASAAPAQGASAAPEQKVYDL
jgi:viroplasmin and RNaseH domain-containing protein